MKIIIRPLLSSDYPAVAKIYEEGIATGNATFNTSSPTWEDWDKDHKKIGRLVAEATDDLGAKTILGWASLAGVSSRCVYSGVAELSVYIAADARGKGTGRLLMDALIKESERNSIWTLQAGVFPENESSIALHEKFGFRRIGFHERIGQMADGRWRDTLLLERRSTVVGV